MKAFDKVELQPGQQATIQLALTARDFASYDPIQHDWIVHPGEFEIRVGSSSRDLPLRKIISVGATVPVPGLSRESMLKEFRDHPRGKKFYPELLDAMGVKKDAGVAELEDVTPTERAERRKAHAMMMKFVDEFPIGKIPAWSEGRFSEARLNEILAGL